MLKKVIECMRRLVVKGEGMIGKKGVMGVVRDMSRIEDQAMLYLMIYMLLYTKYAGMIIL